MFSSRHRVAISFAVICMVVAALWFHISTAQSTQKEQIEQTTTEASELRLPTQDKNSSDNQLTNKKAGNDEPENYVSTNETEPNGTVATATKLGGKAVKVRGDIYPIADVDYYSFYASAGDRVFAATMTSASSSTNSTLDLIDIDGTTILETDLDDGSFSTTSSSIAGKAVTNTGIHYLRVTASTATAAIRFYNLYLQVQSGSPGAEVEPNDATGTATPMNANRFMSGAISSATDPLDFYSFTANAGDTVYLSLDLDPERDATTWNGRIGLGVFSNFILVVNDASVTSPNSEAFFFTVKDSGTYYAFVDPAVAGSGTATSTYNLSLTIIPQKESRCTTYTTATAAQPIGPDTTSPIAVQTINIPDSKLISKARINVNITHLQMNDIDLNVTSPQGVEMTLFNDIGSTVSNTPNLLDMDITFDDEAALPAGQYTVVRPMFYQTENFTKLAWVKGMNAQGTWTITARDDLNGDAGTLNSWSVTICEDPPLTSIPSRELTLYFSDFEASDGGFTHMGTLDEWERGLPSTNVPGAAVINNCNSGVNCWKTDLDNTYDASCSQDLISPSIDLTAQQGRALKVSWAHRYQVESATFDHYFVDVTEVGGSGMTRRIFEHRDNTMNGIVGSPTVTLEGSAGWSLQEADISDFAGKTVQIKFHVDTDSSVQEAGVAIDDVSVIALATPPSADFDADGGTDVSVYRNNGEDGSDGRWYILNSSNGSVTNQLFGLDTDVPVAGDYDGDGDVDIAVFRASEGRWYVSRGSQFDFDVIYWGITGDIAVPADYDGDGRTDAAVFRPSDQTWYILRSSDGLPQNVVWGLPTDNLVPRDYDGDGKADVAVYRDGTWHILQSFYGTTRIEQFGLAADVPVVGDYDGDRKADLAVFRPSEGNWYIRNSAGCAMNQVNWGLSTDIVVQGDYDRDRKTDLAVFRPGTGTWYILRSSDGASTATNWGISSDVPIPPKN